MPSGEWSEGHTHLSGSLCFDTSMQGLGGAYTFGFFTSTSFDTVRLFGMLHLSRYLFSRSLLAALSNASKPPLKDPAMKRMVLTLELLIRPGPHFLSDA